LEKFLEVDDSQMAKHFQYRFIIRDLRARTVEAVRGRPKQPTASLEAEWDENVEKVKDLFGLHPINAYVYKEYGNCLYDMGRHGDALTAYETAYEHLRSDIYNLQLAKLLWLWGSSMAKLGIQGATTKLDQALGIAKGLWFSVTINFGNANWTYDQAMRNLKSTWRDFIIYSDATHFL